MGADSCLLRHDGPHPHWEVRVAGRPLFTGEFGGTLFIEGAPVAWGPRWNCVCWFSDKDGDYLELHQALMPDVHLVRHLLLSKTDHWLLLVDTVRAPEKESLCWETQFTLAGECRFEEDSTTREQAIFLPGESAGEPRIRVCPLSLPQERIHRAEGELTIIDQTLTHRLSSGGNSLAAPLFFDWHPARKEAAVDWSKLTVAEKGQPVPDAAAAFRLRIGENQWLSYHSLKPGRISRTALGLHTFHETVIARVTAKGRMEPLVQVESE